MEEIYRVNFIIKFRKKQILYQSNMALSLKAADGSRVRTDRAQQLASTRINLQANPALLCPASAQNINFDIYGRCVNQNTIDTRDAACSQLGRTNASWFMNNTDPQGPQNRLQLQICAAGLRGGGDTLGVGRDQMPTNLYGDGGSRCPNINGFVKQYPTVNNVPPCPMSGAMYAPRGNNRENRVFVYDMTQDATSTYRVPTN